MRRLAAKDQGRPHHKIGNGRIGADFQRVGNIIPYFVADSFPECGPRQDRLRFRVIIIHLNGSARPVPRQAKALVERRRTKRPRFLIARHCHGRISRHKLFIDRHGTFKELLCPLDVLRTRLSQVPKAALISFPRTKALWRLTKDAEKLGINNRWQDRGDNSLRYLVLHGKHSFKGAVVPFRPDVVSCLRIDKLCGGTNTLSLRRTLPSST